MKIKEHTTEFEMPHDDWEEMQVQIDSRHIEISYQDRAEGPKTRITLSHADFSRVADAVHIYGLSKALIEQEAKV